MPKPVLGGATLIMFGTVAIAGIKILAEAGLHRRNMLIVSISLGLGLGVAGVPEVLSAMPEVLKNIFGRSEEHTSELQSLMRISYAVFCLKKKTNKHKTLLPVTI